MSARRRSEVALRIQGGRFRQKATIATLIGLMALGAVEIAPPAVAVAPSCASATFTPGVEVECIVPGTTVGAVASFDMVAIGAGGGASQDDSDGGNGAHVSGRVSVEVGSSLFVTVGAAGGISAVGHSGGSGGGSTGVEDSTRRLIAEAGGGGGGGGGWVCFYDNSGGSGGGAAGIGGAASESCVASSSPAAGGSGGVGGAAGVGQVYEEGSAANGNAGLSGTGGAGANGTDGDLSPVTYPTGSSSFVLDPTSLVAGGLGYHAGGASGLAKVRPAGTGLINAARANGGGGGGGGYGGGGGGWSEISCYESDGHCQDSIAGAGGGGGSYADESVVSSVTFRQANDGDGYGRGGFTPEGPTVDAQNGHFTLTAVAGAPEVQTQAAAPTVTTSTAVIRSAVNALGGGDATVVIETSTSTSMSSPTVVSITPSTVLSAAGVVTIEGSISGLGAGTTLYYRTTATNAAGTTVGAVESFTTSSASGGGGGGSAPDPEPTASGTPATGPTKPAVLPDPLDPIGTPQNPAIPPGGMPAGGSLLLVNGQPVPITVRPNASSDPVALNITGPGFQMRLEGRGDTDDPLGLTSKQALVLQSESLQRSIRIKTPRPKVKPVAQSSGDGFAVRSPVKFYILPSTFLGSLTTDGDGAYNGRLPIPPGIPTGVYTLQANGFSPEGSVRSLNIGVLVKTGTAAVKPVTSTATVYFAQLSPELTAEGKAKLRSLVAKSGRGGVKTVVVGFVQPTATTSNDKSLSAQRAANVAVYLRSLGLRGAYVVRGDGVASTSGPRARRVNVTVLSRP